MKLFLIQQIKISYRNKLGMDIFSVLFNSTALTNTEWFSTAKETSDELEDDWICSTTQTFTRLSRPFTCLVKLLILCIYLMHTSSAM